MVFFIHNRPSATLSGHVSTSVDLSCSCWTRTRFRSPTFILEWKKTRRRPRRFTWCAHLIFHHICRCFIWMTGAFIHLCSCYNYEWALTLHVTQHEVLVTQASSQATDAQCVNKCHSNCQVAKRSCFLGFMLAVHDELWDMLYKIQKCNCLNVVLSSWSLLLWAWYFSRSA